MPDPLHDLDLVSKAVGPLPIINHFLTRLRLDRLLDDFVPRTDRRLTLAPAYEPANPRLDA